MLSPPQICLVFSQVCYENSEKPPPSHQGSQQWSLICPVFPSRWLLMFEHLLLSIKPMFSWSYSITPRSYLSVIPVSSEVTIIYVKLQLFSPPNTHHEHHLLSTQFHLPVYSPPTIFYSWPLPLPQHTLSHRCYLDQSLTCTHVLYYSSQCMLTTCGSKWCLMNKCNPL